MDKSKTLLSQESTYCLKTGKGDYILKSVLGGGGFGITYLAERTVFEGSIPQIIGGKTKCVKMNETLNQWKAL